MGEDAKEGPLTRKGVVGAIGLRGAVSAPGYIVCGRQDVNISDKSGRVQAKCRPSSQTSGHQF